MTVLIKTRGGRFFQDSEERFISFWSQQSQKGYSLATPEEAEMYLNKYKKRDNRDLPVFFPYWQNPIPNDGYGGVAMYMKDFDKFGGIHLQGELQNQSVALVYNIPGTMAKFVRQYRSFTGLKIAYTMFETTEWPERWVEALGQNSDVIFVPSVWNKSVLSKQLKKAKYDVPVEVVPHGINPIEFTIADRPDNFNGKFRFLMYNAGNKRKGFPDYLQAFVDEFGKDEPVEFICKTWSEWQDRFHKYAMHKNIKLVYGKLNRSEQNKLLHEANCFVFPSKGEGFGLPPLEAMATGMPCIITKAHSHLDFWNEGCYEVTTHLEDAEIEPRLGKKLPPFENHPAAKDIKEVIDHAASLQWKNTGQWYVPDQPSLRKQMRHVYENWAEAKSRGLKGAEFVRENFTYEKSLDKMGKAIKKYL